MKSNTMAIALWCWSSAEGRPFTGFDWSDRYLSIVRAASNLRCKSAIIDGEAIVQNGDGASDFESLRSAMRLRPQSIILYAFDLLHLNRKESGVGFGRRPFPVWVTDGIATSKIK
jgi:hypothetical protein